MRNKLLISFIVLVLITPYISSAQSPTKEREVERNRDMSSSTEPKRETIRNKIEEKRGEMASSTAERMQNVFGNISNRVQKFMQTQKERFEAATNRLEKLASRIEARIAKIEAAGTDESESKDLLDEAKAKIETAKTSITLIVFPSVSDSSSSASTTAELMKEAFQTTKEQIAEAKEDLKVAHAALVDVINSLKSNDD